MLVKTGEGSRRSGASFSESGDYRLRLLPHLNSDGLQLPLTQMVTGWTERGTQKERERERERAPVNTQVILRSAGVTLASMSTTVESLIGGV